MPNNHNIGAVAPGPAVRHARLNGPQKYETPELAGGGGSEGARAKDFDGDCAKTGADRKARGVRLANRGGACLCRAKPQSEAIRGMVSTWFPAEFPAEAVLRAGLETVFCLEGA